MKVKAIKVNRAHYFLTDPRINTQHLHDKTKVLPMDTHLKLHAAQLRQLTQTQTYPLHDLNAYLNLSRHMKATIFHSNEHINIIISKPDITTP